MFEVGFLKHIFGNKRIKYKSRVDPFDYMHKERPLPRRRRAARAAARKIQGSGLSVYEITPWYQNQNKLTVDNTGTSYKKSSSNTRFA